LFSLQLFKASSLFRKFKNDLLFWLQEAVDHILNGFFNVSFNRHKKAAGHLNIIIASHKVYQHSFFADSTEKCFLCSRLCTLRALFLFFKSTLESSKFFEIIIHASYQFVGLSGKFILECEISNQLTLYLLSVSI